MADRFRFDVILGRGSMGTVYRATDLLLGRSVAIKVLHAALTDDVGVKRFEREMRVTAGMQHPNVITVHNCGEADGHLYYVMEDIGGQSLRAWLTRGAPLPLKRAVAIAEQIGAGLQYAHDKGVVHRDIKPENIILAGERTCIVDFGIARIINDSSSLRLTASGMIVGTPEYLSPEQAGAEKAIGPGADQYSLACVLFEMVAGEPPFTGPTAVAVTMRHLRDPAPSLHIRRSEAPDALAAVIQRALFKIPEDRYRSVREFISAVSLSLN